MRRSTVTRHMTTSGRWSPAAATASRTTRPLRRSALPRCSTYGWRPGARIRSACTWRRSTTLAWRPDVRRGPHAGSAARAGAAVAARKSAELRAPARWPAVGVRAPAAGGPAKRPRPVGRDVNLRSWDERWLPVLAAFVQRRTQRLREMGAGFTGPGSVIGAATRVQPALAGSIAVVAVAAVVLAVAGGPGGPGDGEGGKDAFPPSQAAVPVTTTIGPTPGASVASYLTHAAFNLRKFGETSHDKPGYAVVDLHAYLRPDQAARVFNGVEVVRAYVRVPSKNLPTQVHAIPLQSTFASLASGMDGSGRL